MGNGTLVAVLVGGRSQRLGGRPKAALPLGRSTVLERVLAAVEPLGLPVRLAGSPGRGGDLPRLLDRLDLPLDSDRHVDAGPLGGLDGVFAATGAERVLLLACDLPFLTPRFLSWLLERSRESSEAGVVPVEDGPEGRCHPLCAVYSEACRAPLEAALAARRLRVRDFVRRLGARLLPRSLWQGFDARGRLLANLNEPADYARARAWAEEEASGRGPAPAVREPAGATAPRRRP